MPIYPKIDPVAISPGPEQVRWYGLVYLVGFAGGWWLGRLHSKDPRRAWRGIHVDNVVFLSMLGVIAVGRLGHATSPGPGGRTAGPKCRLEPTVIGGRAESGL